jgi:hypothetical protein
MLLLLSLASAGDWDHLANNPAYTPSTWSIMTTAMHKCPGLSDAQLFGDTFVFGVNIAPSEFSQVSDIKEAVRTLVAAYAECQRSAFGETRDFRVNLYEGGSISRYWYVTPESGKAAAKNSTIMEEVVEGGRSGEVMGMLDW